MTHKIYILSYNEKTEESAKQTFKDVDFNYEIIKIPTTKYLENIMYDSWLVDHKQDWINYDYIGTLSWRANTKIQLDQISQKIESNLINNPDVLAFYPSYGNFNIINQGVEEHGEKFKLTLIELLEKLNFTYEQIINPNVPLFLCNYWIAKSNIMIEYIEFFQKVKKIIENDYELKEKLYSDAQYEQGYLSKEKLMDIFGVPYYPLYIFLLERLACYFFYYKYKIIL